MTKLAVIDDRGNDSWLNSPELGERMRVLMKIFHGSKLTKAEKKLAGIVSAELTEQLIWHRKP